MDIDLGDVPLAGIGFGVIAAALCFRSGWFGTALGQLQSWCIAVGVVRLLLLYTFAISREAGKLSRGVGSPCVCCFFKLAKLHLDDQNLLGLGAHLHLVWSCVIA